MDFLKQFEGKWLQVMKIIGALLVGLVLLSVLLASLNSSRNGGMGVSEMAYDGGMGYGGTTMKNGMNAPTLSVRNASDSYMPPSPEEAYAPGDDAEAFEVKEYSARIETRNKEEGCGAIRNLKSRTDVIFESANEYDRGCSFTFKVKKGGVEDVLGILKAQNPRDLTENVYTIKQEVTDFTSELTILQNKLATLDATLAEATASYQGITQLATSRGDVESLAKIIESKLLIVERLTNARIETVNALERTSRAKAEALDRLEYTYFSVQVYENKYINADSIRDSWKQAMQEFVYNVNTLIQEMSIGIVGLLFTLVKFTLYFVILLFTIRFAWTFSKKVWNSGGTNTTV